MIGRATLSLRRFTITRAKFVWTLVVGSAVIAFPAASAQIPQAVTAFEHVTVIPMDRERVLAGQTVIVRGSRIAAVGRAGTVPIPPDAMRVDGRGKFLMPGLSDMHVHLGWRSSGFRGTIADELFLYLANGVTTVRDMHSGGFAGIPMLEVRRRVESGELLGPHIYTAADPNLAEPSKSVEALKAAGYDMVKLSEENVEPEVFDSLVAAARRVGLPVVGHVPTTVGLDGALAAPYASIEHLTGYVPYLVRVGALPNVEDTLGPLDAVKLVAIAAKTKRAGVWNCPTLTVLEDFASLLNDVHPLAERPEARYGDSIPDRLGIFKSFYNIPKSPFVSDIKRRLALGPYLVRALRDAGAGLLLGTDAGAIPTVPGFLVHRELQALVASGLTPYQALAAGTKNVALFLGTADSTGTVEAGKRADLVLLNGNPLQDIRHTAVPAGVMVAGRWLSRAELDAHLARLERHTP